MAEVGRGEPRQARSETERGVCEEESGLKYFQCYSGHVALESREETSLLASAVMFRAFVNALDNGEELDCSRYSLCEGRKQVNSLNTITLVLVSATRTLPACVSVSHVSCLMSHVS